MFRPGAVQDELPVFTELFQQVPRKVHDEPLRIIGALLLKLKANHHNPRIAGSAPAVEGDSRTPFDRNQQLGIVWAPGIAWSGEGAARFASARYLRTCEADPSGNI